MCGILQQFYMLQQYNKTRSLSSTNCCNTSTEFKAKLGAKRKEGEGGNGRFLPENSLFFCTNPLDFDIGFRPEPLAQLAHVALQMANAVKLKLQLVKGNPVKTGWGS